MKCIETLARVDVLCVDKTGTITENEMKVDSYQIIDESHDEDQILAGSQGPGTAANKNQYNQGGHAGLLY